MTGGYRRLVERDGPHPQVSIKIKDKESFFATDGRNPAAPTKVLAWPSRNDTDVGRDRVGCSPRALAIIRADT